MVVLVLLIVAIIAVTIIAMGIYNSLVSSRNATGNAFAQIDVQLTRRHDLIPNLVETAKGYLAHEHDTLEAVVKARNAAVSGLQAAKADPSSATAMQALGGAETQLTSALGRLLAVAEAYPDLKANQTMMQLSEELTSTENKVAFARQAFNDAVMTYNNTCQAFPNKILADMFGFKPAQSLEITDPAVREAPKVSFGR